MKYVLLLCFLLVACGGGDPQPAKTVDDMPLVANINPQLPPSK